MLSEVASEVASKPTTPMPEQSPGPEFSTEPAKDEKQDETVVLITDQQDAPSSNADKTASRTNLSELFQGALPDIPMTEPPAKTKSSKKKSIE